MPMSGESVQRFLVIFTAVFCFLSFAATGQASTSLVEDASFQTHSSEYGDCLRSTSDDQGDLLWSEIDLYSIQNLSCVIPQSVVTLHASTLYFAYIRGPPAA